MRTQRKRIKTCGLASKRIARSRRDEDNMADLPWTDCASIKTATALTNNPLLYIHIFFPNFKFRQVSQHLNKQKLAENLNGKKKKILPQLLVFERQTGRRPRQEAKGSGRSLTSAANHSVGHCLTTPAIYRPRDSSWPLDGMWCTFCTDQKRMIRALFQNNFSLDGFSVIR